MPYTFVDMFAGAGGMSLGLRMAGLRPVLAFEYSAQSAATYYEHHRVPVVSRDLSEISGTEVRTMLEANGALPDLLVGGPPCETFSRAQTKDVTDDPRNLLFRKVVEFAEALAPTYVLVENVVGFRDMYGGRYYVELVTRLKKLGYDVISGVLNAASYGVPQERQRLFILGRRTDRILDPRRSPLTLPPATHDRSDGAFQHRFLLAPGYPPLSKKAVTVEDALADLPILLQPGIVETEYQQERPPLNRFQRVMRSTLLARLMGVPWDGHTLYNHRSMRHKEATVERYRRIHPGEGIQDVFECLPEDVRPKKVYKSRDRRLIGGQPSHTVTAHCVIEMLHYDYAGGQHRAISPREAARLQSFPDWYQFTGSATRRYGDKLVQDPYEQIGDAVPPLLARALGRHVRRYLNEDAALRGAT